MSLFYEADSRLIPVDRSTLERFATCPAQGCYVEANSPPAGMAAAIGEQAHQAISRTIQQYVETREVTSPTDFADALRANMSGSRPDVQPGVIQCLSRSVWGLAQYIGGGVAPQNILRFDGGAGDKSGQLSWPLEDLGVLLTSEVDFLHATKSKELLAELDWKSGWGFYNEDDVADSFQFQFHAFLVLSNYPGVEALRVTVWNTRNGTKTRPVEFSRSDLTPIQTRIRSAVGEFLRWHGKPYELADTWPATEKCRLCPAAGVCPAADKQTSKCAENPVAFLDSIVAAAAKLDALEKEAAAYVDKTGKAIVSPSGVAFGRDKPKAERKAPATLYQLKGE